MSRRTIGLGLAAVAVTVLLIGSYVTSHLGGDVVQVGPDAATPVAAPPQIAKSGAQLQELTAPPDNAHAALGAGQMPASAKVRITFDVYGRGPSEGLVVKVTSAKAIDGVEGSDDLASKLNGQNLVLQAGRDVDFEDVSGGTYGGEVSLAEQDERLYFVLDDIERD